MITKDKMLETFLIHYHFTISEYDAFFNKYIKLKKESISKIYQEFLDGKIQNRHDFERRIGEIYDNEKQRLYDNHTIHSKWI